MALTIPAAALAAGTPACTPINNTAEVTYSVGGVNQTPTPLPSTTATFVVANKVSFTVQNADPGLTFVSVIPGQTSKRLKFTITNTGNANQQYILALPSPEISTGSVYGITDNFNATSPAIKDAGGTALATTATITPGNSVDAYVYADIPVSRANGDGAAYAVIAQAADTTGAAETQTSKTVTSSYGTCTTDVVFADTTAGTDDAVRDGKLSARGIFKVETSELLFSKNASTIWDPITGNVGKKAIPGALVQYSVSIENKATAGAPATLAQITDTLEATIALDPDLRVAAACATPPCALTALAPESALHKAFKVTTTGSSTRASKTTPLYFTDNTADAVDIAGQVITANMATALPAEGTYSAGELRAGETVTLTFNAVIQ
jgi:hypothetical protein